MKSKPLSQSRSNPKAGMSLLELVIVLGIGAGLIMATADVLQRVQKEQASMMQKSRIVSDMGLLRTYLTKNLPTGDLRLRGFTGATLPADSDGHLGRIVIPLANTCRDLSTQGCEGQTSLLFAPMAKDPVSFSSICFSDASTANHELVIDLNRTEYGAATFDFTTNEVVRTLPSGGKLTTPLKAGTVLVLSEPPNASLWIVRNSPLQADSGISTDCESRRQPGETDYTGVIKTDVRPLWLSHFTGGTAIGLDAIHRAVDSTRFPYRTFKLGDFQIVGPLPNPNNPHPQDPQFTLGVRSCSVRPELDDSTSVKCDAKDVLWAGPFKRVRLDEVFNGTLNGANPGTRFFELRGKGWPSTPGCSATDCQGMDLSAQLTGVLTTSIPPESRLQLSATAFSLLKQDFLSRIRIRAQRPDGGEEVLDVPMD